ncbi:NADH-quinone oxidoreductase subunit A, partial [Mycolicibacterium sp.]|uniref:NADH-quinone oxidoreductase subunit A n=1 Tax=Mycolicibacterium sp. TaxID=2320850 RepID=UPI003D126892
MNAYMPIVVLGAIAAAFALGSLGIALWIGPRRYNRAKLSAYECGVDVVPQLSTTSGSRRNSVAQQRFPVRYYVTAMLFIVFDIEIVFLYPWAVAFDGLGLFAVVEMLLFMVVVFV